ncbi:CpsD/CapB family tyrosine-protein kinase [Alkalilacustris brevis]|uniref:CpsD/CapB family tyrosine-protein kinase n=1 Tax=Alkalilacustris brevis TaxID=2026338 RepID=UPI000E0D7505|nr:CpsD/CapB family tyrosine-protein kinase [Alkalilacustris brevis]
MPDRIQTALAKARARRAALARAREGAGNGPPGGAAAGGTAAPEGPSPETVWAALPEIHPSPEQLARSRLHPRPGSEGAAPFDQLRGQILRQMSPQGWRRVAITSPDSGCGSSTVAANLALSLARQPGQRILLIEADMHRPALAGMLGLRTPPQFAQALRGSVPLTGPLLRLGDSLCLALNGAPESDASDLLQRADLAATLQRLEALLAPDVVLFDLPPMLADSDTLAFLDKVDCAILVAAADATALPDLEGCAEELARHTHSLGVVLNKLRLGAPGYWA